MFIKASERLYLAFIFKMYKKRTREQQAAYNEQRRANKSKTRQASFIAEYIQAKYFHLYGEACTFYNSLNTLYPTKYDLRKTTEFRQWKSYIMGKPPKTPKRKCIMYSNAENNSTVTEISPPQPPIEIPPQSPDEIPPQSPDEMSPPVEIPPQSPDEIPPQSPDEMSPPVEISPQSPDEMSPPVEISPQSPDEMSPHVEMSPQSQDEMSPHVEMSPPQPHTDPEISTSINYSDRMELKIPLLRHDTIKKRTVTTETLQITTQQEELLTLDDIPRERITELIQQLRDDPDLRDIFASVEEQLEFEELGMDIDICESYPLEDELFW